jgi:hypothetical protein
MATNPEPPTIRVELTDYSMFATTPAYQVQAELDTGKETVVVFGLRRNVVVPDPSDELFTVPSGGARRLDLISQKHYGTPSLWDAILDCNPGLDPLTGPEVADVIAVPTRLRLASLGLLSI